MKSAFTFFQHSHIFKIFILFSSLLCAGNSNAADFDISDIEFSQPDPASLFPEERININFKYKAKGGNVYIFARPFYDGNMAPDYSASGSGLYYSETGKGTQFFTLLLPGKVDSIHFTIYADDHITLLHEEFLPVDYTFADFDISNLKMTPDSPGSLFKGADLYITFNYLAKGGNVLIFARPFNNGAPAPDYAASGTNVYLNKKGSGAQSFTLLSGGQVDSIRFSIYAEDKVTLLYEEFVAVDYTFADFDISNVVMTPASPATLLTRDYLNITFNYLAKGGNVRIYARPYNNGALAPDYAESGSNAYSNNTGSGALSLTMVTAGQVDSIRFTIYAEDNVSLLYEEFIAVNYSFTDFDISDIVLTPASPATLRPEERVNITFNYRSKGGYVYIYARPVINGTLPPDYVASASMIHYSKTGSGKEFFTLSAPGKVDSIHFTIYAEDHITLLHEEFLPVNYVFKLITGLNSQKEESAFFTVFPFPASDFVTIRAEKSFSFTYLLYDMTGKKVIEGITEGSEVRINIQNIESGIYILKAFDGERSFEKVIPVE
jgi:hypothetical protein